MNDWISVEDHLPTIIDFGESDHVLVINGEGELHVGGMSQFGEGYEISWWTYQFGGSRDDSITYWMPLPEKPK